MRTRVVGALAAASLLLTACGGGSSSTPLPSSTAAPSRQPSAQATFVVKIPPKRTSSSVRTPKYLTADIQGIQFSVTQPNNPGAGFAFYAIGAQQPYCTTPAGGGLVCTLPVVAAPGDDTIVVTTYDRPELWDANVISTGSVEQNISAQSSNTVNIVTSGIPTFFAMSVDNPYPTASGTQTLHLLALDADANVIVGPYDVPITLSNSDASGVTHLSATTAASSTDAAAITLAYNGAPLSTPATITVQSNSPYAQNWNGSIAASLHFAPGAVGVLSSPSYLTFANTSAAGQTITVTGSGTAGPFAAGTTLDAFNDWGILDNLNEAWQFATGCTGIATVAGTGPTFTVSPVHTGVCYLSISDSSGHYGAVPIVVQSM